MIFYSVYLVHGGKIMYKYNARVVKVIDGDTVELEIDLGFKVSTYQRIRLAGFDAPETRTKDEDEKAKGLYVLKIARQYLDNADVTVQTRFKKTFDRYVGVIYKGDLNINRVLTEVVEDLT